ncbi:MAG: hypothetical protein ABUL68_04865, partial [Pseudomonadota bacterium]
FGATFRKVKRTPGWEARHGLDTNAFVAVFDELVSKGYMPTDLATAAVNQQIIYNVIFDQIPDAKPWVCRVNLTAEEFKAVSREVAAKGYKLKFQTRADTAIGPFFAALWQAR